MVLADPCILHKQSLYLAGNYKQLEEKSLSLVVGMQLVEKSAIGWLRPRACDGELFSASNETFLKQGYSLQFIAGQGPKVGTQYCCSLPSAPANLSG
jgi:hypothetical protein